MVKQSAYEKLEQRVNELEKELAERKQKEKTLRENTSMVENILEKAADGICVCHNIPEEPFVRFTHWNPRMTAITGYTMGEINKLGWYQTMYPESRVQKRAIERMARMRAGEDILVEEWVVTTKDGKKRPLSISTSIVKEEDGKVHVLAIMQDITERKQAEEALRTSEEKYRGLVEQSLMGIGFSHGNQVIFANPALLRMFGYENLEEFTKVPLLDHVVPAYREKIANRMRMIAHGKMPQDEFDYDILCKDGKTKTLHAFSVHYALGGEIYTQTTFEDITERKQAEEALRESEERFRAIFDGAPDGFLLADVETKRFRLANRMICEMLGYSLEEITQLSVRDIHPEKDLPDVIEQFDRLVKGEIIFTKDLPVKRKGGSLFYANIKGCLLRLGGMTYLLGMFRDITERKRSLEALQESEEQFRQLAENIHEIFYINDADKAKMIYVSPAYEKIWGRSCQELYKHPLSFVEAIHPEDRDRVLATIEKQRQGERIEVEYRIIRPDASLRWIRSRAYPVLDKSGILHRIVGVAEDITEHRQTEEAFRKSQEQYRTLMENLPIGICRCTPGPKGEFLMANPALVEMLGYDSEEELKRINVCDIYMDPNDREAVSNYVLEKKSATLIDRVYKRKDGTPIWCTETARLAYLEGTDDGAYFDCAIQDITERRKAEEALREAYDIISRSPAVAFLWKNEETWPVEFVSDNVENLFGYTAEEFVSGKVDYASTVHPDDLERVAGEVLRFSEEEGRERFTHEPYRIVTKDGKVKWLDDRTYIRRDERGKITHYQGIVENITERKRAEEALHKSEERYRDLFNSINDFIYTHDLEGHFLSANRAATQTLGYSPDELIGKSISDFMLPEYRQAFQEEYLPQVKKQGFSNGISIYLANDGRRRFIEYRSNLVEKEREEPYVSGVGRDITEKIEAEKEVKKLEDQVQYAQRMEAIGTLAGGIAHDFNNLLMAIQGNASLILLDVHSGHPHYEKLKNIEQYVQSGADLTRQLLGFARRGKYETKPTDLNELIKKGSGMFGRTKKEITIHSKYQKGLWTAEVDQGQIEQMLLNLYVNAWQAMPGGGELYLETENVTLDERYVKPYGVLPGKYIKISVTDTGVGMDRATQARIFDPFFTTKEMGRGIGLGLASAYGIIKNHGGIINVYSEKGEGTTFNIYLPASEKAVLREKEVAGEILRGTGTVLLVDDEEMIREVGKEILKSLGYEVFLARSGREAVEIYGANRNNIDLVILDMIMPQMSGGDTFDRLRAINSSVKVLLSSGYSINGQAQNILDRGCNGFIQKPFTIKDLLGKLRELLDKK